MINQRQGETLPNKSQLNHELNLRNYKSVTDFKAADPWVYPQTKKSKAVVVDRGFFPSLPRFIKKSSMEEELEERRKKRKEKFIEKFKYREQNL